MNKNKKSGTVSVEGMPQGVPRYLNAGRFFSAPADRRKGGLGMNLTREQAIERCGLAAVESVERENCEPTNTVGYNGRSAGDALSEWSATVDAVDTADGLGCKLTAYYYIGHADEQAIEDADGDGGAANWVIDHYAIN